MTLSKTDLDLIKAALAEDLAGGEDITSVATIDASAMAKADFTARKSGVIAGIEVAEAVLREVGLTEIKRVKNDGDRVNAGDILLSVSGNTRAILLA